MIDTRYAKKRGFCSELIHYTFLHFHRKATSAAIWVNQMASRKSVQACTCCRSGTRSTTDCVRTGPVPLLFTFTANATCLLPRRAAGQRPHHAHRLRSRSLAFGWVNRPIEPTAWPEARPQTPNWHRLFYCTHTMPQKLTANRSSAREARSGLAGYQGPPVTTPTIRAYEGAAGVRQWTSRG